MQRPQEALTAHAVDATLRTVNAAVAARSPAVPPQLAVTTGDAIDNAQWNEVQAFLALFDGGRVVTGFGRPRATRACSRSDWPDDIFWKPDGIGRERTGHLPARIRLPASPGPARAAHWPSSPRQACGCRGSRASAITRR